MDDDRIIKGEKCIVVPLGYKEMSTPYDLQNFDCQSIFIIKSLIYYFDNHLEKDQYVKILLYKNENEYIGLITESAKLTPLQIKLYSREITNIIDNSFTADEEK